MIAQFWFILPITALNAAEALLSDESMLVVRYGEAIPIEVDGIKGSAAVDPSKQRGLTLSPRFATRQDLGRSRCRTGSNIGPVEVPGVCKEAWINMSGRRFRRTVAWYAAFPVMKADVLIGPADLPHRLVRVELRPAVPGERAVSLPLFDFDRDGQGLGSQLMLNGRPIRIYFTLKRASPLATAGAGSVIAAAQGGRLEGTPQPMLIELDVRRPVQLMRLDRPLELGPLSIDRLGVRVSDYGRTRIAPARSPDPEEIVVAGIKPRDRRNDWLALGTDALAGCSSLTFDKKRMTVTLSCR